MSRTVKPTAQQPYTRLKWLPPETDSLDIKARRTIRIWKRRLLNLLAWQRRTRYEEMIKLAWYKIGYLEEHPAEFVTPEKFCFRFQNLDANCACGEFSFSVLVLCASLLH
ncbi:hypothetical protein L596_017741 [Steinernema carpocapsae]|uniref:Transposase Tc5 C-terminal domain-containing protein n=1 Tax=Steinernema carpocapsae TaxID=34508 RepID=A0A4U5N2I8_STECR|nr:hypothetical protein L596_017741 [Steinernema carpocapsae]